MLDATLPPPPSVVRHAVSALLALALAAGIWALIEWRSAPPPVRGIRGASAIQK